LVKDALLEPSDEEVLGYSTSEEDEDDVEADDNTDNVRTEAKEDLASEGPEEGDEDAGGWGSSKRDYYNADNIETEADALEEEAEAKRLQQKKLQKMSEADFGFDENEWLDVDNEDDNDDVVTEVLKDVEITADMGTEERLSLLKKRYPEFESLSNEFLKLQPLLEDLRLEADTISTSKGSTKSGRCLAKTKLRGLAAYLGALTMYFAVLTSTSKVGSSKPSALDPMELRDHTVMESLLQCRQLWSKVMHLKPSLETELEDDPVNTEGDMLLANDGVVAPLSREPESKKSRKERVRELAAVEASRSRAERIRAAEEELQNLSSLLPKVKNASKPSAIKSTATAAESDSDFGEEESLSARSLAEKAAKKKSLRFYTSQIAQKVNRRADAGRDAGGDADLPYRERLRDRQARLNAEAEKRGRKLDEYGRGAALGGDESGDEDADDMDVANAVRGEEDDYYDMIAQTSRKRKDDKAERYAAIAAAKAAGRQVRVVEGEVGADGKRAIGRVIQKNKGLAQKRKKDVRNPRVKKRKKYEEKKKKLASMKPVYKGGEERGGYGGEKTGIKTMLVKSVKL
jgi:U3 small nucleolar RNA-associated protein 3